MWCCLLFQMACIVFCCCCCYSYLFLLCFHHRYFCRGCSSVVQFHLQYFHQCKRKISKSIRNIIVCMLQMLINVLHGTLAHCHINTQLKRIHAPKVANRFIFLIAYSLISSLHRFVCAIARTLLHPSQTQRIFLWVDKHKYKSRNYCKSFKSILELLFVLLIVYAVAGEPERFWYIHIFCCLFVCSFAPFWLQSFHEFICKHANSKSIESIALTKTNTKTKENKLSKPKKTNNVCVAFADRLHANTGYCSAKRNEMGKKNWFAAATLPNWLKTNKILFAFFIFFLYEWTFQKYGDIYCETVQMTMNTNKLKKVIANAKHLHIVTQ